MIREQPEIRDLRCLLNEILDGLRGVRRRRSAAYGAMAVEVEGVAQKDYKGALRALLSRPCVLDLMREARRVVWPRLNRDPVTAGPPTLFLERWSSVGVDFSLTRFPERGDVNLLGFYLGRKMGLARPLICINTSHHPVAMSAAFAHEMGHHIASLLWGRQRDPHLLTLSGYDDHLRDPQELAADLLVTLGAFPARSVRDISRRSRVSGDGDSDPRVGAMLFHMDGQYGPLSDQTVLPRNRLLYLAWVVHYVKLRLALFDEYDL